MIDTSGWDWGDVPTWVGAITTLGALIAAGFVVIIELRRDNRATRETADRREQAERAEQADAVAAWSEPGAPMWAVVLNGSRLPIYNVEVTLSDATLMELFDVAREERDNHFWTAELGVVAPGERQVQFARTSKGTEAMRGGRPPLHVSLSFTDTGGRRWQRDEYGDLQRLWDEV